MDFDNIMHLAIAQARISEIDVPVGAVLLDPSGFMIAASSNHKERNSDATAHAEILVIREAGRRRKDWRLLDLTLVVTLEPCVMCAAAIVSARIPRVVFGAYDLDKGGAGSRYDILRDASLGPTVEVIGGIAESECSELLVSKFRGRRPKKQ